MVKHGTIEGFYRGKSAYIWLFKHEIVCDWFISLTLNESTYETERDKKLCWIYQ
jgi:hypothetical protein